MVASAPIPQAIEVSAAASISTPHWFSFSGYAVRFKTRINPLVCGQEAFAAVARALKSANETIDMAFWGFDPGNILIKSGQGIFQNSDILANLLLAKANAGVKINLVVWDNPSSYMGSGGSGGDEIVGDNNSVNMGIFNMLSRASPNIKVVTTRAWSRLTAIGSFHQKMIIVDVNIPAKATAFVMGHNMMPNYWDTIALSARNAARETILKLTSVKYHADGRPLSVNYQRIPTSQSIKAKPMLDVSSQIWGAAVLDVYHAFSTIWRKNGETESPEVTSLNSKLPEYNAAGTGMRSAASQVAVTYHPSNLGIREQYLRAIGAANRYVVMVNQYLRDQNLARDIIEAWKKRKIPDEKQVRIYVISNNWENKKDFETDPAEEWDRTQYGFDKVIIDMFEDAGIPISLVRLVTQPAAQRRNVYVHAKVLIVDGVYMNLGSANFNDRSMRSDPELNIGAHDTSMTVNLRRRLMDIIIGKAMNNLDEHHDLAAAQWFDYVNANTIAYVANANLPNGRAIAHDPVHGPKGFFSHQWASNSQGDTGTALT